MSVKKRLRLFIKNQSLTISAFEESINASNGYVNSISKSIGIDKLEIIIEKYSNLNIEWLLTGKGEMLKAESKDGPPDPVRVQTVPELQQMVIDMQNREINRLQQEIDQLKKEQPSPADHTKPTHSDQ